MSTLSFASAPNHEHEMALQYRRGNADVCRQGHPLRPVTFNGGRECDVCCLAVPHSSSGLCCDACSYDVCPRCTPASAVPLDLLLAFDHAIAAAHSGHATSQYLVGMCYDLGEGVEQSDADAAEWCAVHALQCHRFSVLNCDVAAGTVYPRTKALLRPCSASVAASAAPAAPGSTARTACACCSAP
jgi:TPR repeat protein